MSTQPAPFGWKPTATVDLHARISSFYQTPAGEVRRGLTPAEIVKAAQSGAGRLWVDVDCQHTTEWLALAQTLDFHPLAIEDTLSPESRLKLEEYEGYVFVVARDASFNPETPDPYDFESSNLYLFLGKSYLFTVHARPSRTTSTLVERIATGPELMDRGVDYLAYALLDTLIDSYFPMLDQVDNFIDELESQIFEQKDPKETLTNIFELKRTLLALRRHQAPMREMLATMANRPSSYLQPATQIYFRDVYDHVVRQVESIETYRDLLTGALEIYFSVASSRMNEIMKTLTIVGTFLLPATWVASIYGMNFEWMPYLHQPGGFWVAMGAMFFISLVLIGILRLKRWV
ncbi:MAG: magnesium/cobalt transporter CorA [Gemmatimonadota bacterium]